MSEQDSESKSSASLDALAWSGGHWLWRCRLRDGLRARLPRALRLLLVVPVLAIAIVVLGWLTGQPWKPPFAVVALLCPLPSLVDLLHHGIRLWNQQASRREGLAVYDEALDLEDRLQTADEFLTAAHPTPFMMAAIADAGPSIEQATRTPLEWGWGQPWNELRHLAAVSALAILLLVIGVLLPTTTRGTAAMAPSPDGPGAPAVTLPVGPDRRAPTPERPAIDPPKPTPKKPEDIARKATKGAPAPTTITENPSSKLSGSDKISLGTSEGGQTSQAASSGRASESRGMPGSQAPSSLPEKQQPAKKKEEGKKKEQKPSKSESKKTEDQSGATAGRGSSGGSSKNPASTDWASKDRTESADTEDFEQEEDVDDEDSESEARGGLQPNLRDRRPPVNRDLSIGFGNMASEDSNGRGGPGERKKSRGVAGLVLGVPIPDHVKGQPNPGRVKVTQERVQPQGEDVPGDDAEDRGRRSSPAGHLSERTLDTTMRDIVREYFLKARAEEAAATPPEPSTE